MAYGYVAEAVRYREYLAMIGHLSKHMYKYNEQVGVYVTEDQDCTKIYPLCNIFISKCCPSHPEPIFDGGKLPRGELEFIKVVRL